MKILALETSGELASIALCIAGEVQQIQLDGHKNHSEQLLPCVKQLLATSNLSLTALDAVAFGTGPGAFTSVRLACSVAQALAMGADLPIAPVSSLAALAYQATTKQVLAITDARMGEVYAASFELMADTFPKIKYEPVCCSPDKLDFILDGNYTILGSAIESYAQQLSRYLNAAQVSVVEGAYSQAKEIALIARYLIRDQRLIAPELASPHYVRNKVALTTQERLANKVSC